MSKGTILAFSLGAAIGSVVTWKIVETKYKQITQEEIESAKAYYEDKYGNTTAEVNEAEDEEEEKVEIEEDDKPKYTEYVNKVTKLGYTNYSDISDKPSATIPSDNKPYVIRPDQIDDVDYNIKCLSYYSDGVLTDEWGNEVDIEETVGEDALTHFGEYEEDTVYVRNDELELDYEICRLDLPCYEGDE